MVLIFSIGYLNEELKHKIIDIKKVKEFYSLAYVFIFSMLLVVTTQNLGVMWIGIEATTLASAFLVGFYNNKLSLEAAWKYIIICSVGIAFGLLGIIFMYSSAINVFQGTIAQLNWTFLFENAHALQSSILKISFLFILIGFGTKVGLVPMHTWLPDAHSQAPSPISALLSGVLLNSALYSIIRVLAIVNKNLGDSIYTGRLLMTFGLLSIATAAIFIIPQKDYKRLLAYSSIEHMGIIAFALGIFTPLSIFAGLFHMINHAFTKSMLFLVSGNVYLKYNTKRISQVKGLLKVLPFTGFVFLLGIFAIVGMPPFSVFASEISVLISAVKADYLLAAFVFIILIVVVFAGVSSNLLRMFFGNRNENIKPGELNIHGTVVIVLLLITISVSGIYLPHQIKTILDSASSIVMGGK
jgi:hydrogenase-4 component F